MFTTYIGNFITYESNNTMDYEGDLTKLSWAFETILLSSRALTFKYLNFQQEKTEQEGCRSWEGWSWTLC